MSHNSSNSEMQNVVDSQSITTGAAYRSDAEAHKATVARTLIGALSQECVSYCILSGYDRLPDSFETDIDFMVDSESFVRMPHIIDRVARETKTRMFHTVAHELSARSYSLGSQIGERLIIVQPDSTADYRHFGLLWLRSREVLAMRRWHPSGFWIPAPQHEFAYYLIKRLNKCRLDAEHGLKLHRLYLLDPARCDEMIARFWKGRNFEVIRRMAQSNEWGAMREGLDTIRSEMRQHSEESPAARIMSSPKHASHYLQRLAQPTGGWIAIIGPDGAGKSAVIDSICKEFRFAYDKVRCFHLRPKMLRRGDRVHETVTDPHGKPPRGILFSVAKLFMMIADYWLGYVFQIAPAMRRSQLVVFDRYVFDFLVDCKRIRYGGPARLLRMAAMIVPHPELVILLDAAPEVLWSRKREVPYEEVVRQRSEYVKLAGGLPNAKIVNASQALADVIRDVNGAILAYFERRTADRLHLENPTERKGQEAIQIPGQRC